MKQNKLTFQVKPKRGITDENEIKQDKSIMRN